MSSAVGVRTGTDRGRSNAEVQHSGAVEHGRIIETDGARHAVTELRGVLDVVHAGHGVMTAHQERGVVARITMPRRRIGRSRLTEGEACELDERHFNRDVTTAGIVQQVAVQAAELTSRHEASTTRSTGGADTVAGTR